MIAAIYQRITVKGTDFVEAKLTPTAERHRLALALPDEVGVCYGGPDRMLANPSRSPGRAIPTSRAC